jgi:signal transduction histidine kinase
MVKDLSFLKMRPKVLSLKLKFTIMAISIGIISFGVAAFLSNQWMTKSLEKRYKKEALHITTDILHELESAMKSGAHGEISEALNIYRIFEGVEEIRAFDLKGHEVFTEQKGPDEPRVKEIIKTEEIIKFDKTINGEPAASYLIPIRNKPECHRCHGKSEVLMGGLLLSISLKEMKLDISQYRQRIFFLFTLIAMAISISTILAVNRIFLKPLNRIQKGAEAIGKGDFRHLIPVSSNDEIGDLAKTFNQMSTQLKESFESIQKSQERVTQAEKLSALGHLSARLAHELRNPLTSIKMILQAILDGSPTPEMKKEDAEVILKEVKKLDTVLTHFLTFAKPTRLELRSLNLGHVIEEVFSLMKTELDRSGVEVFQEISGLPEIKGDYEKMRQVLINLLHNSIQAMPEGGKLKIGVQEIFENGQRKVLLRVEDSGQGIPEEYQKKVFDPFFTTKEGGTGLGLSIVYSIVKEHQGSIDLQSQVGHGTVFAVAFTQERLEKGENG